MKPITMKSDRREVRSGIEASSSISIDAPVERVWALIADVGQWPRWNPAVSRTQVDAPLVEGSSFTWKSQGVTIRSTVCLLRPMKQLTWTGRAPGTSAEHHWILGRSGHATLVTTSETFEGWLPRLMPRLMQTSLQRTLDAWLATLKREAEKG